MARSTIGNRSGWRPHSLEVERGCRGLPTAPIHLHLKQSLAEAIGAALRGAAAGQGEAGKAAKGVWQLVGCTGGPAVHDGAGSGRALAEATCQRLQRLGRAPAVPQWASLRSLAGQYALRACRDHSMLQDSIMILGCLTSLA